MRDCCEGGELQSTKTTTYYITKADKSHLGVVLLKPDMVLQGTILDDPTYTIKVERRQGHFVLDISGGGL